MSPFGYGEICWRDFEAMLSGATLFKQRMDHLDTWPGGLFEQGVTYVGHAWDFSDFADALEGTLSNPRRAIEIAEAAQERFIGSTLGGADAFVAHLASLCRRIVTARERPPGIAAELAV
jgi:hypothetical protein